MPEYQLQVAVVQVAVAVASLAVFTVGARKSRQDALPTFLEGEEALLRDPFDVTRPEDTVDGTPLREAEFWTKMRLRKLFVACLLGITLVVQTVCLGWSIAESDRASILVYALQTAFALYALSLAGLSINQTYGEHARSTVHLSILTFFATIPPGVTAILPSTPLPSTSAWMHETGLPLGLWYAVFVIYAVCLVLVVTTPRGPPLHFPSDAIYSDKVLMQITSKYEDNVCGITGASVWDILLFSYTTKVVMLGNIAESLEIGDLPIVAADMRATTIYASMRDAMRRWRLRVGSWRPAPGSGIDLGYRLVLLNRKALSLIIFLAALAAILFYTPAFFLKRVVYYLEVDPERENRAWGFVYCVGLFLTNAIMLTTTGQLWSVSTTTLQVRMRIQLNSILFQKTLVRKDIASSAAAENKPTDDADKGKKDKDKDDEDDFSSKAQIMTLMTTDVDRVSEFSWHLFTLVDAPIEIIIGTIFLYDLLGVSCFFGLAVTCLFLPLSHFAGKVVVGAQDNLMKARDERVSLMNEVLGGIRMLKFMAWERSFEARIMKIRQKELKYQKLNFTIEVLWQAIFSASPILVTLVSFWHFSVVRGEALTPSIAFTSISVFNEMKFALNALPETFINMLQSTVSLRRIEKYLGGAEVAPVAPLDGQHHPIALQSATTPSTASTPRHKFMLMDLTLDFPIGELSLTDILAGQVVCPRSPPDIIASFAGVEVPEEEWVVPGVCAYVPQTAWLRNASIRDNILFNLPYVEKRYQQTLEACALLSDFEILEDGDQSEIGERGVNLSGGQKARVSLARAVYSRASVLLLDDVLSAVDAHTARHLYNECLRGDLMKGRTLILVSHHVQLCAAGAKYIVSLDNGRVQYSGDYDGFQQSGVLKTLVQTGAADPTDEKDEATIVNVEEIIDEASPGGSASETSSTIAPTTATGETEAKTEKKKKAPRRLIEEEKRAMGRIGRDVWKTYIAGCGSYGFWALFGLSLVLGTLSPVFENGWLRTWSGAYMSDQEPRSPIFYITVYAIIALIGLVLTTLRWFFLLNVILCSCGTGLGSHFLTDLLEGVLFANIRFHDTISRGVDSNLPDHFGRSLMYCLSVTTTFVTITVVGGPVFVFAALVFGFLYYNVGKVYGQTSRDMRRLDSVTRSPLYSIYGETIAGVAVLRAFGASSKFLRDMLRFADTNANPYYWMWSINRWLSARFNLLSSAVIGTTAFVCVLTPGIDASLAGFALAFASSLLGDVRRFVGLEQSMVAVERIKEFSELPREPPEFIEPRPAASWPEHGEVKCENLVIRYAPELPNVLHQLTFDVRPGEKVGVLGRTGSGKSTLALSFFRFVEPTEGRILIDGVDISKIGLTDLRSNLTIIPQDPIILSGTLRTTLDVFNEYQDVEIYEALRRVHLIPSGEEMTEVEESVNVNVFRNLDSPVSEGGENFSTGEKQLLCMARAILKRSKVLLMDEVSTPVSCCGPELIEFASSTILTIAHRLRTVIDYDRVMLLDQGRIAEYDTPGALLSNPQSKFYALCKATGKDEFAVLRKMAGI
ncbi:multidrug resistance-associated ABC transporter [Epithele typhae]|uniref:multidrug resistance-associated ABC transporter n=1 Tax=Epithele typhae TaxID=378194 RepID=UPI0020074DAF|nr:multidrug resistance-associated ABC transporter [Epithele typhae]KAH9916981.1 multidrug resistance-associated ABC transporter [Epithele typhae]